MFYLKDKVPLLSLFEMATTVVRNTLALEFVKGQLSITSRSELEVITEFLSYGFIWDYMERADEVHLMLTNGQTLALAGSMYEPPIDPGLFIEI